MANTLLDRTPWPGLVALALAIPTADFLAGESPAGEAAARTSELWGVAGEKWTPESRLPDFSFAGYRRGEEPYRIPASSISMATFGARGDGRTDDTGAFKKALAAGKGHVVIIPPGRYLLNDRLEIRDSNLVLRGAGAERTTLLFARPLEEIQPRPTRTDSKQPTSGWSWGGGLITINAPEMRGEKPVAVTGTAARGTRKLTLAQARFRAGDEVVLSLHDDNQKTLLDYLYRGQTGNLSGLNRWQCEQVFRIVAVLGQEVTLDRPLRFEVRGQWRPTLHRFMPAVTDAGIESLGFEFPARPYAGHFKEVGFNPVEIGASAAHCWLRDLKIWNADSGPYIRGTFCTVEGIRLGADAARKSTQGHTGHHGITFYAHDCLCTNFTIETEFIHDLTVQSAIGCVFCAGRAANLNMDHHRWAPYENLFTDLDAGECRRLFSSSGGGERGLHSAAGATFWNIRGRASVKWPREFAEAIHVIAVNVSEPAQRSPTGRWYEPIAPGQIQPANLYAAMLRKRLGKLPLGGAK